MKQITSILIGAGLRGGYVYSQYALDHPDEFKVIAVAEPDQERRELFAAKHNIPKELQYESYEELLQQDKMADCAMICTQDKMHYEPVTMAMQKGYHVLCEKPMSPDKEEIIKMGAMAKKYDRILSVCHVLRYSPFFSKIKEILEEGRIGRMMSIQHIEEVGYWHHAHSFVYCRNAVMIWILCYGWRIVNAKKSVPLENLHILRKKMLRQVRRNIVWTDVNTEISAHSMHRVFIWNIQKLWKMVLYMQ